MADEKPWSIRANYSDGWRAVGGRLRVLDGRLVFGAHAVDRALAGRSVDASLTEVAEVGVAERSFADGPFSGGMRRRLRVRLADGRELLFVVNKVERRAAELRALVAAVGGSAGTA